MAAESDETLARKLQAEFDAEETVYQHQLMMDARTAAAYRAHDISDSDSDATIEPPDYNGSLDGSCDLFDTSSRSSSVMSRSSSSLNRSRQSFTSSPSPSKSKQNTLLKKVSKIHEISDSESDTESKQVVKLGNKSKSNPLLKSSAGSLHPQKSSSPKLTKLSPKSNPLLKSSVDSLQPQKSLSSKVSHTGSSTGSDDKHFLKNGGSSSSLKNASLLKNLSSVSRADQSPKSEKSSSKPVCKYGDRCYRTNPDHFQEFDHEGEKKGKRKATQSHDNNIDTVKKKSKLDEGAGPSQSHGHDQQTDSFSKTVADVFFEFQPLSLFLTKVSGIDDKFNTTGAVSLKDILSPLMGNLQASCQFNFMTDIPWLISQYPKQFRDKPLLLVHGEQGRSETELKAEGAAYANISFCRAKLEIMYGTHHTKMMLLLYDCGLRVVIHTANLIHGDWHQKTQGVWISPLFPKLQDKDVTTGVKGVQGDSPTHFKADLLAYLAAYRAVPLTQWEKHIQQHDMSSANVYIIASVPGRHSGGQKSTWGHLKLRKVLQEAGPERKDVGSWSVIGQFSSIGSLGATPDQWLCDEWLASLSQCQGMMGTSLDHKKLQLVYPSKENVRLCLEGYAGGGCLPYSIKTAQKQIYLNNFIRKWGSEGRGRTEAIPHIKTYTRVSPDYTQAAWFLVTSANMSKAAWGALEKQKTQLMIRSYEIGVLFLPKHFGISGSFPVAKTVGEVIKSKEVMLPFPYDLPPPTYQKGDRIWMWDVPCVDLPDTHGKKYCPRL